MAFSPKITADEFTDFTDEFQDVPDVSTPSFKKISAPQKKPLSFENEFTDFTDEFQNIEEPGQQPANRSLMQSFKKGLGESTSGLLGEQIFGGKQPEEAVEDPGFWERLVHTGGEITGDLPYIAAGATLGGALGASLGSPGGPVGAGIGATVGGGFGSFALPAFLKQSLKEYKDFVEQGNDLTFGEFLSRADKVASETLKSGAFGVILGSINKAMPLLEGLPGIGNLFKGKIAQKGAGVAAETAALGTLPAVAAGRLPEARDYADALALTLGFNVARLPLEMREQLQRQGESSGLSPEEFAKKVPAEIINAVKLTLEPEQEAKLAPVREILEEHPRKIESAREERIAGLKAKEVEKETEIAEPFREKIDKIGEEQKRLLADRKQKVSSIEESFEEKRGSLESKLADLDQESNAKLEKIAAKEEALTDKFEEQKAQEIERLRSEFDKELNAKGREILKTIETLEKDIEKRQAKVKKEVGAVEKQIERAKSKDEPVKRLENLKDSIQTKADKAIEALQNTVEKQRSRLDAYRTKSTAALEKKIERTTSKEISSSALSPLEKSINTLDREIAKKRKLIAESEAKLAKEKNRRISELKNESEAKLRALEKKKVELERSQSERLKVQREKAYAERHPVREVTAKKTLSAVKVQAAVEPLIETTGEGAGGRIEYAPTGMAKAIDKMNNFIQAAKTPKESLKRLGEGINEGVFNALAPLERVEAEIPVPEKVSTRIKLAQSVASEINNVFENGIFSNQTGRFEHGGLKEAYGDLVWKKLTKNLKPHEYSLEDLDVYRTSKIALRRQAEGKKVGVDTKEAMKDISRLKDKYEPIDKRIRDFQKATLSTYGKDLLGKDLIDLWNKDYYSPLYRVMEEGKDSILANGSLKPKQPFKKMVGSGRKIIAPSESDVYNSAMLIRNARKNDAILQYRKLVLEDKLPGKITKAKIEPMPKNIALDELGIDPEMKKIADALYSQTRTHAFTPEKNILRGWKNGEAFEIEVPENIYNVFSTLAPQDLSPLAKIFSATNRLFSRAISFEPRKFISITARDALSSLVYSRTGSNPLSVVEALGDIYGSKDVYKEFLAMGGDVYASRLAERIDRAKTIDELITPGKEGILVPFEKIGDFFRKYGKTLGDISMSVPLAEYKRALSKYGNTPEGRIMSAMEARRTTYDPTRKGGSKTVRELGNFIPFWNVSLQDMASLGRNLKSPDAWAKGILALSLPTMALKAINEGNPDYQDLTPADKAAFWHLYFGDKHIRIPVPWLLATVFKVGPETFYDTVLTMKNKNDKKADEAWQGLYENLSENVSGALPPLATAYIEQATGKSPKSPLSAILGTEGRAPEAVPRRLQNLPAKFQYTSKTSQLARWFGDHWNISPVKVDRLIKGFAPNLGADVLALTDEVAYFTGMAEDKRPEQKEKNYLLLGHFVSESTPTRTKYINEFYEYLNEASQNKAAQKLIREKGLDESLDEIDYKNVPLGKYQRQINDAFKKMRAIEDDSKLKPHEKKVRLNEMQRKVNDLYKTAVERVRVSKKENSL